MKTGSYRLAVGLLLAFFSWAGASPLGAEPQAFEMHPIGFAEPETALALAREIVGEDGFVALDRRHARLLVRTEAARHVQLRSLLARLDVPPRNVRIEVEFDQAFEDHARHADLGIEGGVVVTGRDASGRVTLRPSVGDRRTRGRDRTRQSLLVASGREATLRVGERVPYLQWIHRWGIRHGVLEGEIRWQDVGAFLAVEATVIGEGPLVRIRLTPTLSGRVEGRPHEVRYAEAATEVTVSDGQTLSIGGLARDHDFYERFLVGFDRSGGTRRLDIRLTPHISTPDQEAPGFW